eukprot:Phypoly_transcript_03377.p1 GENE.Phypoly_transcript_03377~~Phypoly_transcript_03377.p1  ORF type:complete len:536 (+),score=112.16 Phypoly_transcript_03377:142-1749(+)
MLCYWQAIKSVPFTQVPTTINSICKRFYTTPAGKLYISNKHVTRFAVDEPKKKKKKGYRPTKKVFKYFLIHKPYNVLSQFTQPKITTKPQKNDSENNQKELKTLKSFFPLHKDVYPVGRLDSDSEGLLLLTNNIKGVTQKLLHPQQKHERTYLAQVEGIPTPDALKKLQEGVKLKEFTTLPAKVELLKEEPKVADRDPPIRQRKNSPTSWIKLILIEGKNRQVRRMTAAVGFPTLRLIRINFAGLELGELGPGKHRPLTSEETELLENKIQAARMTRVRRIGKGARGPFEEVEGDENDGTYTVTRTGAYTLARLVDARNKRKPARVDMVGIDIGKSHTGICGFDCSDAQGWPRVTAIALLNAGGGRGRAAHYACDQLDGWFARDPQLAWVRESSVVHVEQQLPQNPQAKQVAQGIRSALRCLRMANGDTDPCVTFTSGQAKYAVAPAVCPELAQADPLRAPGVVLTGHKNKPQRKMLGERDAHAVLRSTAQDAAIKMIAGVCRGVDQIHDVTDALLIGMAGEIKRAQGAKTKKKK